MSITSSSRHIVHLVVGGFSATKVEEIVGAPASTGTEAEILVLTDANVREALDKIFSAAGVAVWGEL